MSLLGAVFVYVPMSLSAFGGSDMIAQPNGNDT